MAGDGSPQRNIYPRWTKPADSIVTPGRLRSTECSHYWRFQHYRRPTRCPRNRADSWCCSPCLTSTRRTAPLRLRPPRRTARNPPSSRFKGSVRGIVRGRCCRTGTSRAKALCLRCPPFRSWRHLIPPRKRHRGHRLRATRHRVFWVRNRSTHHQCWCGAYPA